MFLIELYCVKKQHVFFFFLTYSMRAFSLLRGGSIKHYPCAAAASTYNKPTGHTIRCSVGDVDKVPCQRATLRIALRLSLADCSPRVSQIRQVIFFLYCQLVEEKRV